MPAPRTARAAGGDTPAIDFNVDAWEYEDAATPFAVVVGGKRYVLQDPLDADYRDLAEAMTLQTQGDLRRAMELIVPEADHATFFANKISMRKMNEMFRRYNEHFGLDQPGEASASSS